MPHYERGVYEPTDEVRVFDGSEDDEDVEGSRLPLLIVLALLVLAMFAGVVWLAYSQGVARGRTEPPVIAAAAGPARIAPQNPGGAQQPYQGFKIYEQPAPPDDDSAASVAPAAATPPPAAANPPAALVTPPAAAAAPPAKLAIAEPAPRPAAPVPAPVKAKPAKPVPVAAAAKPAITPPPAVKPAVSEAKPAEAAKPQPAPLMIGPATAPPRTLGAAVPAAPKPAAATLAPKPVAAAAPAASGSYVLQIGAYKSQADADAAWKTYKAKHAALLSGYSNDVQQADLGEKGTWYRLRVGGLADREVASALCDRLKADGGACLLGK